jgi:uncharacterized membrane protein
MIDDLYALLVKIGFNEPLHPPITHMPIGLAAGALIFLLVALLFNKKNMVLTAKHVSILAFVFVFPTVLLGVFDWVHFYHATLYTPIKIKMGLAAISFVLLGTGIILGSEIKFHSIAMVIVYALTLVSMVGLGYFGAGIIYGRGMTIETHAPKTLHSGKPSVSDSTAIVKSNAGIIGNIAKPRASDSISGMHNR